MHHIKNITDLHDQLFLRVTDPFCNDVIPLPHINDVVDIIAKSSIRKLMELEQRFVSDESCYGGDNILELLFYEYDRKYADVVIAIFDKCDKEHRDYLFFRDDKDFDNPAFFGHTEEMFKIIDYVYNRDFGLIGRTIVPDLTFSGTFLCVIDNLQDYIDRYKIKKEEFNCELPYGIKFFGE